MIAGIVSSSHLKDGSSILAIYLVNQKVLKKSSKFGSGAKK
jgi:hypothetical protein